MSQVHPRKNLAGLKFGRLTVVGQADEDYIKPDGRHVALWNCLCDCGNPTYIKVSGDNLKNGSTQSCGCYKKEISRENGYKHTDNLIKAVRERRRYNTYDLDGEYGIGITKNNEKFLFDLEDYDKIKNYLWYVDKNGYVSTTSIYNKSAILQHRVIMDVLNQKNVYVDHISHDTKDNRKQNLRLVTPSQNSMNKIIQSNNTTGVTGVYFHKPSEMWCAYIKINGKQYREYAHTKEEAIKKRKQLEEYYFKEYSYAESMRKKSN